MTAAQLVAVTLRALDPPFAPGDGILFGLESRGQVADPVPADATTDFGTEIEVRTSGDDPDFAGVHVSGRRGDRFIYLAWGAADGMVPFAMFARAKIKLGGIPADILAASLDQASGLVVEIDATNPRGQPATGTIHPPAVRWFVDRAT